MFNSPDFSPEFEAPDPPEAPISTANVVNLDDPPFNSFFFDSFSFSVTTSGFYFFDAMGFFEPPPPPGFDNGAALFLYAGAFNPVAPLQNIIFGATEVEFGDAEMLPDPQNNPFGTTGVFLTTGTTYVLVTSSLLDQSVGRFNNEIACPGGTCAPGQIVVANVVPEPSTIALSASGLLALAFAARRRRSSTALPS